MRRGIGRALAALLFATGALAVPSRVLAGGGQGSCHGHEVTIEGTDGPDRIDGTRGADVIDGRGGNDVIYGGGGNGDFICGGGGADEIHGGMRAQTIWGDDGHDTLNGKQGNDVMYGGDGDDKMFGSDQSDELNGNAGDDFLHPGNIATARDGDFAFGGLGNDKLRVTGYDIEEGGPSFLFGNVGRDRLVGSHFAHWLEGGPGNDVVKGGSAAFSDAPRRITADARTGRAIGDGRDKLIHVVGLRGSRYDDRLKGSARDDVIFGFRGADELNGRGGDDTVDGGKGRDSCSHSETEHGCEA